MITVDTYPAGVMASGRPIIFEVDSNRFDSASFAVSGTSSGTGGRTRFAVTSHTLKVGDTVTGSSFAYPIYNLIQVVTAVSTLYFETNIIYASSPSSGSIQRTNNNFQVKCETFVFPSPSIAITGVTNSSGVARFTCANTYAIGDIVSIENTTDYNGMFAVTVINAGYFSVGSSYTSNQTGITKLGTLIGTKRQDSILNSSGDPIFRMNCAGHVGSALSPDLIDGAPANIQTPALNSCKLFAVRFTEEFDDNNGQLQDHDVTYSPTFYSARAVWQHKATDQSLIDYYTPGVTMKFLTNAPMTKCIRPGEEEQLHFLANGALNCRATIQKYDLGGSALSLVNLTAVDIKDDKGIIPINSNVFNSSISKFVVWLTNSSGTQLSEKRTYIVDKNQYQNAKRFHFENTLGGCDAYTFTGKLTTSSQSISTTFKKTLPLQFSNRDRGTSDLANSNAIAYDLFSALLSRAEGLWLNELIISVSVFMKNVGETVFTPVNILGGTSVTNVLDDSDIPPQMQITYSESNAPLGLFN